jgi:hypothetical protein
MYEYFEEYGEILDLVIIKDKATSTLELTQTSPEASAS